MKFYDSVENVNQYIEMAKGFDGRELIKILKKYVPEGSSVLELGMGPGVDLEMLSKSYDVTGSDNSIIFIERFRHLHSSFKLIQLDVNNIKCNITFDCIYSNKVLHHLTDDELRASLLQQRNVLANGGVLFHTFWLGEKTEEMEGMLFNYHTADSLRNLIGDLFDVEEIQSYREMDDNDSLYIILRKSING